MPKRRIHTAQRKCTIPVPHSTMIKNMTQIVVEGTVNDEKYDVCHSNGTL